MHDTFFEGMISPEVGKLRIALDRAQTVCDVRHVTANPSQDSIHYSACNWRGEQAKYCTVSIHVISAHYTVHVIDGMFLGLPPATI